MSRRDDVLKYFNEQSPLWRERAARGVEEHRKGDAYLSITDAEGKPIRASVRLRQKTHDFKFGANLFMLEEMESAEKNEIYKEKFAEAFNLATLPFYWSDLEPVEGKPRYAKDSEKVYRRPAPDLCLEYCRTHGIAPKAHCLTYVNFTPDWVNLDDIRDAKTKLQRRYASLAERYADEISDWEVINETLCKGHRQQKTAFFKVPELVEWNFALAEKYFTANKLIINEATHIWQHLYCFDRSPYYLQIERALSKGARIDSIGMQFHNFVRAENEAETAAELYNPAHLYEVLDTYARLNKPIQLTEVTIPAYTDSEEDEALQAELLENLYRIWFSHPATEAIIYWNLVDGYAAFAPQGDMSAGENYYRGGLLRFDMSVKPAYTAIQNLFEKEWRTNISVQTDAEGKAAFRGFYGTYDVEITLNGQIYIKQIHLRKGAQNHIQITL